MIHESLSCEASDGVRALLEKVGKLLGFDYTLAAAGSHDDARGTTLVEIIDAGFPREFGLEFFTRHYFRTSRVISEHFRTYRLRAWSEAWGQVHQLKEIVSLFRDFGMSEGYTHGAPPLPMWRYGSIFCFSSPSLKRDRRAEAALEHLTPHLHLALSKTLERKPSEAASIRLSAREKEILDWLKQGKSSWDVSAILNISERTVNFHVYNVLRKLGVVNRAQAVAAALRLGLIELS